MKNLFNIFFLLLFVIVKPVFAQDVYTQTSLANALKVDPLNVGSLTIDAKKEKKLLKFLDQFIRLNDLTIINCDTLPVSIFALKFVKHIEIKGLNYMPNGAYEKLGYLTKFEVEGGNITDMPDDFGKIPALKEITIKKTALKVLPNCLTRNLSLETINLQNNKITTIPVTIRNLKLLKYLMLDSNNITILPVETGELTNLEGLSLSYNPLNSLPVELTKLKYINLVDICDTKIPQEFKREFKKKFARKITLIIEC